MTYILPIELRSAPSDELLGYLGFLAGLGGHPQIVVVDGSGPGIYADFEARRPSAVQHVGVDGHLLSLANGKVAGVLTGVRRALHPRLVIADDDVRYDERSLAAVVDALEHAEIVRPQNFFAPLPWHACLDTARMLINLVSGGDWPGTFGVRRGALEAAGGYDGDVLFENLELVSPARLAVSLALIPGLALSIVTFGWMALGVATAVPIVVAETGRRIGHGAAAFPVIATLAPPVWVLERGFCTWAALMMRLVFGGVPYAGRILCRAATPSRIRRRRYRNSVHVPIP